METTDRYLCVFSGVVRIVCVLRQKMVKITEESFAHDAQKLAWRRSPPAFFIVFVSYIQITHNDDDNHDVILSSHGNPRGGRSILAYATTAPRSGDPSGNHIIQYLHSAHTPQPQYIVEVGGC